MLREKPQSSARRGQPTTTHTSTREEGTLLDDESEEEGMSETERRDSAEMSAKEAVVRVREGDLATHCSITFFSNYVLSTRYIQ